MIVRKLFGTNPMNVMVNKEQVEFDAEGVAEVSEDAAATLKQIPGYEVEEAASGDADDDEGDEDDFEDAGDAVAVTDEAIEAPTEVEDVEPSKKEDEAPAETPSEDEEAPADAEDATPAEEPAKEVAPAAPKRKAPRKAAPKKA